MLHLLNILSHSFPQNMINDLMYSQRPSVSIGVMSLPMRTIADWCPLPAIVIKCLKVRSSSNFTSPAIAKTKIPPTNRPRNIKTRIQPKNFSMIVLPRKNPIVPLNETTIIMRPEIRRMKVGSVAMAKVSFDSTPKRNFI